MVLDIALARYDNTTPFGFKMVGGADFDVPLQVVRILPGSIAEEVGMSIGDVVVRINDIPTSNLSYYDAHQLLACAGNRFVLGILRAREIPPQQRAVVKERTPGTVGEVEYINRTPKPFWTPSSSANTNYLSDQPTTTTTTEEREIEEKIPDVPITDEQIAEIMSGEAEVLKQHNIIGVNFNKMIPTAGVFKQSEVFKTLNSELVQTEDEEGDKKWTTFMQKPSRPPPKTREEKERETCPASERYQVRIVKQPKPKVAPDYKPPKSPEPEPEPEPVPFYDEYLNERTEAEVETIKTLEAEPVMVDPAAAATGNEGSPAAESSEDETSEEFREQLQNVQKQLEALSSLPNTIQLTIAALTEQLAALAQPKRKSKSVTPRPAEVSAAEVTEIVPEVAETFEVSAFTKTEDEQGAGEQSTGSSDEGEHIEYTEEQLEKLQQRMKEHDIEWTDRNDKPRYQTVDWAITARRFYLVVNDLEQIEYITLPLKISEEIVPEPAPTEQEQQQLQQQSQLPQVPAPPGFFPV
ncbi:proteoglycan 4-like isoform X5 [Culex pipiens pallens]|uniref:proteoglycan 4-like isoform X5 n=1 Tax=Culex pipiens pallens TaxID=42434 RepID=UPI001952C6EF|nr:proteoglycan 4-like isoform X5 [Culex pipiens pallens]